MNIRGKFTVVSATVIVAVIFIGLSGLFFLNEMMALQRTAGAGIETVSNLWKVNVCFKNLLLTNNIGLAVEKWESAAEDYRKSYLNFVDSPSLTIFLSNAEFRDKYDFAERLIQKNEEQMKAISTEFKTLKDTGKLGERGIYIQVFLESNLEKLEFYNQISSASSFFGDITGEALTSLVTELTARTSVLQKNILVEFIVALLVLSTVVLFLTIFFSGRIVSNIHAVKNAVQLLSTGDVSHRLDLHGKDEFGDLSQNYNTFLKEFETRLGAELDFMRDMRGALTQEMDLRNAYRVILEASVKDSYADAGALLLVKDDNLVTESVKGFFPPFMKVAEKIRHDKNALSALFLNSSWTAKEEQLPGSLLATSSSVFIKNNAESKDLPFNTAEDELFISSLIAIPLIISGKIIGAILVIKTKKDDSFTSMDYIHLNTFADYAALMIDNMQRYIEILEKREIDRDLSIAANVQNSMLPKAMPVLPGAEVYAFTEVARGVSGDYYDIVNLKNGRWLFACCDVSGKGIAASFLMVVIRTILRLISGKVKHSPDLLRWINYGLRDQSGEGRFATMAILTYDSQKREIRYSNAAHPPLLIKSASEDTFREIDEDGLPVGIDSSSKYGERTISVSPGDVFVLYSDGVTEARAPDKAMYGQKQLEKVLAENADLNARDIVESVRKDIARHRGSTRLNDDTTLLVLKIN